MKLSRTGPPTAYRWHCLPKDVAQNVLAAPQVHAMKHIDHHHQQGKADRREQRARVEPLGPKLCKKRHRCQSVFLPESTAPKVFVVILGSLAQPTYPIPSPTRKRKQLFVPHPITPALLQHRLETQGATLFQKPPLLASCSRLVFVQCPKRFVVEL